MGGGGAFGYGAAQYKTDDLWMEEYKEQFGTEPSFM